MYKTWWRAVLLGVTLLGVFIFIVLLVGRPTVNATPPVTAPLTLDSVRTELAAGRWQPALYQIEALAAQTGWSLELYRLAGEVWQRQGQLEQVTVYWSNAAALAPQDEALLLQLADTYVTLRDWSRALDVLNQVVSLRPDDAWANYHLGLLLIPTNPARAAHALSLAVLDPSYTEVATALLNLFNEQPTDELFAVRAGRLLAEFELWPYAENAFAYAAAINAPYPLALAYQGLARDQQGLNGGSLIAQAVALTPQDTEVLYVQGLHLRAIGNYAASQQVFAAAVELDPQNAVLTAELGTACELNGDLAAAETWLTNAVALSGEAAAFQERLALFYANNAASLPVAALERLAYLTVDLPENADVRAAFGWALYQNGQAEDAATMLRSALTIDASNDRALYYQARMLLDEGRTDEARPLLEEVAAGGSRVAGEAQAYLTTLQS